MFSSRKKEARDPRRHEPELSVLEEYLCPVLGVWYSNVTQSTQSSQGAPRVCASAQHPCSPPTLDKGRAAADPSLLHRKELWYILYLGSQQVFNLCSRKSVFFPPRKPSKQMEWISKESTVPSEELDFSRREDHSNSKARN